MYAPKRCLYPFVVAVVSAILLIVTGITTASGATARVTTAITASVPPPLVTLLFSRSALGDVAKCVENRAAAGVVWLDTTVAPELLRRGLRPTGTLETSTTQESSPACLHYDRTLAMSWADAAQYRDEYGWEFVSHGQTRVDVTTLTDARMTRQISGSLQALLDHGHTNGSGMYAYQNNKFSDRTQAVVRQFYDFGRTYRTPVTANTHRNADPLRYQWTSAPSGGSCSATAPAAAASACATSKTLLGPDGRTKNTVGYKGPANFTSAIKAITAGQWLTIQSYAFVTGARPGSWDCTSANPKAHWTTDAERYCWKDYLTILDSLLGRPDVVTTDPHSVARLWYPTTPTQDMVTATATVTPGATARRRHYRPTPLP